MAVVTLKEPITPETVDRAFERYERARGVILEHLTLTDRLESVVFDSIPCPCCQDGTLQFSYEGKHTKHIRGKCSTPDCAQWIE